MSIDIRFEEHRDGFMVTVGDKAPTFMMLHDTLTVHGLPFEITVRPPGQTAVDNAVLYAAYSLSEAGPGAFAEDLTRVIAAAKTRSEFHR